MSNAVHFLCLLFAVELFFSADAQFWSQQQQWQQGGFDQSQWYPQNRPVQWINGFQRRAQNWNGQQQQLGQFGNWQGESQFGNRNRQSQFGDRQAGQVRQCSCQEQAMCVEDMKRIGEACMDECWFITGQVTPQPQLLRQCFRGKETQIDAIVNCFQSNMNGCVADRNGPYIPRQEIDELLNHAEGRIRTASSGLRSPFLSNMQRIIGAVESFGDCSKRCAREKTAGGICLQRYGCQPLLPRAQQAEQLFNQCNRLDFKRESGVICNCAVNAGVRELANVCPILSLMGKK